MAAENPDWLPRRSAAALLAFSIIALAAVTDALAPGNFNTSILYIFAVMAGAATRSRRFVSLLAGSAVVLTFAGLFVGPPPAESSVGLWSITFNRSLVALSTVAVAALSAGWISRETELARQNRALDLTNREVAAREEEIAAQNEELQSQSEELERQAEELRVTNDELAARERTLALLLALSRELAAELTSDQVMATICSSLGTLLEGAGEASAMLLRDDGDLRMRCHVGFGPGGPREERAPYLNSFASLIIARGEAGFLNDLSLRPEINVPQPRDGSPFQSVLGAPIIARGAVIGTLEAYARRPTLWTEAQLNLVASVAAQASISLDTAFLFEQLDHQRARFETVFRTMPLAVLLADDPACEHVAGNPAAAALFAVSRDTNFSPSGMAGMRIAQSLFKDREPISPGRLPIVRAARHGEELHGEEIEFVSPSGRRVTLLASAAPFTDPDGSLAGGVCVLADITAHKELQRQLDARRRESDEANLRKTRFFAALSHDVRTPANAIRLHAELLKRAAEEPKLAHMIPDLARRMENSAVGLGELLGELLDFARFDSEKIEVLETEFSLGGLLSDECRQLGPVARAKGLTLDCVPLDPPIHLRTDRVKLARVLRNLIENAVKFTETGTVTVGGDVLVSRAVRIAVKDSGPGIPTEIQHRIFDEFFQLGNPERARTKGTGLGLAISKRLIEAIGAELSVNSREGEGSTFTIILPATMVVPKPSPVLHGRDETRAGGSGRALEDVRILVVDDHDETRQATATILRAEGALVNEARDGRSALASFEARPIDIVLLDLMLPDMDGLEVLGRLRVVRPAASYTVIVLTGDSARRLVDIKAAGADVVLLKPFEPGDLVRRIRTLAQTGGS